MKNVQLGSKTLLDISSRCKVLRADWGNDEDECCGCLGRHHNWMGVLVCKLCANMFELRPLGLLYRKIESEQINYNSLFLVFNLFSSDQTSDQKSKRNKFVPVLFIFSGVIHKITNLWKFELNWSLKLQDNIERKKKHLVTQSRVLQMLDFETSNSKSEVLKSNSWKITSFS